MDLKQAIYSRRFVRGFMACAAGLGTYWIGFAQARLRTREGKAAVGLPQTYVPVVPIIVGHPKSTPPSVSGRGLEIRWIEA